MSGRKITTVEDPYQEEDRDNTRESLESIRNELNKQQEHLNMVVQNSQSRTQENLNRLENGMNHIEHKMTQKSNQTYREIMQQTNQKIKKQKQKIAENQNQVNQYKNEQLKQKKQFDQELSQINQRHNEDKKKIQNQMNQNKAEVQGQIRNTENRLRNNQRQSEKKLRTEINKKVQTLRSDMRNMNADLNNKITETKNELSQALADTRKEFKEDINNLQAQMHEKESSQLEIAESWLDASADMINVINNTRHTFFVPGKLDVLKKKYHQIKRLQNSSAYQAMIAQATTLFEDLNTLYDQVNEREYEWNNEYLEMEEHLANTISKYNNLENLSVEIETLEDMKTVDIDIDYWTEGKFSEVKKALRNIAIQIDEKGATMALESLKETTQTLTSLQKKMEDIKEEAIEAMLASQKRVETVQLIDSALQNQGYSTSSKNLAYENEDNRKAFHALFSNGLGDEISVVVRPDESDFSKNNLEIDFFNEENDEAFFNTNTEEIYNTLRQEGLNIEKPKAVAGYEHQSSDRNHLKDIDDIRQDKTTSKEE